MVVAGLPEQAIWSVIDSFVLSSVIGGRSYDAFILQTLRAALELYFMSRLGSRVASCGKRNRRAAQSTRPARNGRTPR